MDSQRLRDGRTGYLELGYDDDVIINAAIDELLQTVEFPLAIREALQWICGTLGLDEKSSSKVVSAVILSEEHFTLDGDADFENETSKQVFRNVFKEKVKPSK